AWSPAWKSARPRRCWLPAATRRTSSAGGIFFALGATGVGLPGWHAARHLWRAVNPKRRKVSVLSDGAAEPDFAKGDCVALKGTGEEDPTSGAATSGEDRAYFLIALSGPSG